MTMESGGGLVHPGVSLGLTREPPGHLAIRLPTDQAPAPTLTHHLVMSTKQQEHSQNSDRGPFRDENVCFIQTTSFYIPISTWFPCLGPVQATFKVATHCLMRTN